ncbi:MAG: glycosyltransferase family 39 protein [Candidatus Shapirobacteria bacterium]|nr:glycosyltransferase family 39 protein [Candidatus Shapirobacteria bacterium]
MSNNLRLTIFIILITIVSFTCRFWQLTNYPVHLSMDEATIGINAYSVLETGNDEWGFHLPLAFKSVGDYKPPVNVYLTVISIKIFGYTEFAIRFPSAFIGTITPIIVFFLLLELSFSPTASLFASLWLAVLPWHIHYSRGGYESVTALFCLIAGILFLIKWFKTHYLYQLVLTVIFLSLSVWTYHAERLLTPIITIVLLYIYRLDLKLKKYSKNYIIGFFILCFFAVPFLNQALFSPAIKARVETTSFLHDPRLTNQLSKNFISNQYKIINYWAGKYVDYFDLKFISWQGMQFTPPEYPDVGLVFLIDVPFLLLGLYQLIKSKNKKLQQITWTLILLGPLPASLAMNDQHALRALTWLPAFIILMTFTFEYLKYKLPLLCIYFFLLLINFAYFFNIYTIQSPYYFSEYSQYGFKQAAVYACQNEDKFKTIVFSDTFGSLGPLNTGLPYLYVMFYCQKDPTINNHAQVAKYEFRRPDWKHDMNKPNLLLIATPWDILNDKIPENQIIETIKFKNGHTAFVLIKT